MDKHPLPNRRAAMKSSAAAITCAMPLPLPLPLTSAIAAEPAAKPDHDALLRHFMAEWRAEYDAITARGDGGAEIDARRIWALEQAVAGIRPATLEGFAIKLLILTNYGEHDLDGPASGIVTEAQAIAGIAPPAAFRRS